MTKFSASERLACKVLGQHRSTQRKKPQGRADEEALAADIIRLATCYGRYGYRRITAMLRSDGWMVNAKRVERIWRREGLKVPLRQSPVDILFTGYPAFLDTGPIFGILEPLERLGDRDAAPSYFDAVLVLPAMLDRSHGTPWTS